ncbi:E3 SUMO-protein ligase ZBED1-like [Neoarius graeffei]|uniref:E3 SUMO-protein ligase ZBED1-like n=1 Tax=Neoarius graeffei TaxID=443677 RepID=UPI00298CBEC8|nr:E3 SUMO-protein ligase ZBED1-like [Neoarius graeffei]
MTAAMRRLTFQHMPCVAHLLQRTITVCLADSGFTATLARCRKIVGHFKHSPSNTEELHQEQTQLGQDNEPLMQDVSTRWNSTLLMVSRLLKNQDAVKATLAKQKHKLTMLTTAEWDGLQRLETLLSPCRGVTELLGGENYVSCSVVLPALRHLTRTMEASDDDPAYVVKFKAAFEKELSQREDALNHGWLRVATALDPRFKDLKCLPRGE